MVDDVTWYGNVFQRAIDNDGTLTDTPEAYPCQQTLLPHQHHDIDTHFPAAVACEALKDDDPYEDTTLEEAGAMIGIRGETTNDHDGKCMQLRDAGRVIELPVEYPEFPENWGNQDPLRLLSADQRPRHDQQYSVARGFVRLKTVEDEDESE